MALTDEQLEYISDALIPLFQYLETQVIIDVANRIKESLAYTRTAELAAENMQRLGYSPARIRKEAMKLLNADPEFRKAVAKNTLDHKREVKKILRGILKSAQQEQNGVFKDAADLSYLDNLNTWKEAGKPLTDNSFLPQLVKAIGQQTCETMVNLTQTTGFKTMSGFEPMESLYRRELDKAMIKVCTGTFSREQVVYDVVHSLANSGLRTIDFSSGWSMQLDTAVKLAMRTSAHQLAGKITDANMEKTGENLVYVSKHWGARNTGTGHANHEQWQGKVYFIKEGTDYRAEAKRIGQEAITSLWHATGYSADGTQQSDPLGLNGYNCRHKHYVWFEGVSEWPDDHNESEPAPVTINGKTYDYYAITQKQRAMERSIRALKREREALKALNMDTKEISAKIRGKIKDYEDFSDAAGVSPKNNRLRYEGGTSDLDKTKAWRKYKQAASDSKLKSMTLSAGDRKGEESEPVYIGQIDTDKREEAVKYFSDEIRNSETERLVIIDKQGNVYYNDGGPDSVQTGALNLTDSAVIHNHPDTNGIQSFGKDDFNLIRDRGQAEWYLVNAEYDYYLKKIKSMDQLSYNQYYLQAMQNVNNIDKVEDLQHEVFELLKKEGYVEYARKKADRKPTEKD